jgi:hypothetical protein
MHIDEFLSDAARIGAQLWAKSEDGNQDTYNVLILGVPHDRVQANRDNGQDNPKLIELADNIVDTLLHGEELTWGDVHTLLRIASTTSMLNAIASQNPRREVDAHDYALPMADCIAASGYLLADFAGKLIDATQDVRALVVGDRNGTFPGGLTLEDMMENFNV